MASNINGCFPLLASTSLQLTKVQFQQFTVNNGYTLQQIMLGELDSYMQKIETQPSTYTIHKNKFKMDKRLTYKS